MSQTLWSIGHSTRPIDEFIELLKTHRILQLIDVRSIHRSRHNPQFNTEPLKKGLKSQGLKYVHMPQLGGLRKPKKDSANTGWRNDSFRGYADYMQSDEFWSALDELMAHSRELRTVIMCAEAVPWRCHRSLIADALLTRGWEVLHITSTTKAKRHQLTSFAKIENGVLSYPRPYDTVRLLL